MELIFLQSVYLIGFVFLSLISYQEKKYKIILLSPFIGLGIYTIFVFLIFVTDIKMNLGSLHIIIFSGYCFFYIFLINQKKYLFSINYFEQLKILFIGFALVFSVYYISKYLEVYTFLETDSATNIGLANYFSNNGEVIPLLFQFRQIFIPSLLMLGKLFSGEITFIVYPFFSIWFGICFGYFIYLTSKKNITSQNILLSVISLFILITNKQYLMHSFYVGEHLFVAIFLFLCVYFLNEYQEKSANNSLIISAIFLSLFAISRRESIIFIIIPVICYLLINHNKNNKSEFIFLKIISLILIPIYSIGFIMVLDNWYLDIINYTSKGKDVIFYLISIIIIIMTFFLIIILFIKKSLSKFYYLITKIIYVASFSSLIVFSFIFSDKIFPSLIATKNNLFNFQMWGLTWYLIPILIITAVKFLKNNENDIFLFTAVNIFILQFLLVLGRAPYREGWGDSFNRMAIHVLPLFVFFIINTLIHNNQNKLSIKN